MKTVDDYLIEIYKEELQEAYNHKATFLNNLERVQANIDRLEPLVAKIEKGEEVEKPTVTIPDRRNKTSEPVEDSETPVAEPVAPTDEPIVDEKQ